MTINIIDTGSHLFVSKHSQQFRDLLWLQGGGGAGGGGGGGVKWTDEEVDMLHSAVRTFAEDLQNISETIKQRTVQQIKTALKKKVNLKI